MLYHLLRLAAEAWDVVASGIRRMFTRRLTVSVHERSPSDAIYSRCIVLCAFQETPRPDLLALLRRFKASSYHVVVASATGAARQYAEVADAVITLTPAGRDFAAYQQAYRWLREKLTGDRAGIGFLNDSCWYFEKYHDDLVTRISRGLDERALVAGTMILDEVPHVSGWLFAVPFDARTQPELDRLFERNFARKSRQYNIRIGEHRILPTIRSVSAVRPLVATGSVPAVSYCYEALMSGAPCPYLKADAVMRTDPTRARLQEFLDINTSAADRDAVLRWTATRSAGLLRSHLRMREMREYRKQCFPVSVPLARDGVPRGPWDEAHLTVQRPSTERRTIART